jgi:RHH-type proline utilization regulon transcriptional repressor/proline dehydrogenase/delta 1-pyrroline-5-carboxylate dehydrogenase
LGFTIDAEEADRLDLQLEVFAALCSVREFGGWAGLGLAVQAYQKRAPAVIDWLGQVAREHKRRLPVRLVKGAYWDSEIKRAQELGLDGYPVFTRKASTDVSYLACARKLLADGQAFFPMFATHNAHTLAAVKTMAGNRGDYEFQRLHGMGEELYDQAVGADKLGVQCRIYAPVGAHEDLLAYLVRRLLENGANTSFVNRLADDEAPIASIVADPVDQVEAMNPKPHPRIPLPKDLFGDRKNSHGLLISDPAATGPLLAAVEAAIANGFEARPLINGEALPGDALPVFDPAAFATDRQGDDSDARDCNARHDIGGGCAARLGLAGRRQARRDSGARGRSLRA